MPVIMAHTIIKDIGLHGTDLPAFFQLLALIGVPEPELVYLTFFVLLSAAFEDLASDIDVGYFVQFERVGMLRRHTFLHGMRMLRIVAMNVHVFTVGPDRWYDLATAAYVIIIAMTLTHVNRVLQHHHRSMNNLLRCVPGELTTALTYTLLWAGTRNMVIPHQCIRTMFFMVAIVVPVQGSRWRPWLVCLWGVCQAMIIEQSQVRGTVIGRGNVY